MQKRKKSPPQTNHGSINQFSIGNNVNHKNLNRKQWIMKISYHIYMVTSHVHENITYMLIKIDMTMICMRVSQILDIFSLWQHKKETERELQINSRLRGWRRKHGAKVSHHLLMLTRLATLNALNTLLEMLDCSLLLIHTLLYMSLNHGLLLSKPNQENPWDNNLPIFYDDKPWLSRREKNLPFKPIMDQSNNF